MALAVITGAVMSIRKLGEITVFSTFPALSVERTPTVYFPSGRFAPSNPKLHAEAVPSVAALNTSAFDANAVPFQYSPAAFLALTSTFWTPDAAVPESAAVPQIAPAVGTRLVTP